MISGIVIFVLSIALYSTQITLGLTDYLIYSAIGFGVYHNNKSIENENSNKGITSKG